MEVNNTQHGQNNTVNGNPYVNNGPQKSQFDQAVNNAKTKVDNTPSLQDNQVQQPDNLSVFQGHDGHEDPDDNPAMLASAAILSQEGNSNENFTYQGVIYGDTQSDRQDGLAGQGPEKSDKATNNYDFFKQHGAPGIQDISPSTPIYNTIDGDHSWNLDTAGQSPSQVWNNSTNAGQALALDIAKSITDDSRMTVYAAGGGHNAAAEAINILESHGFDQAAIRDNFAIVQHSGWNMNNANEGGKNGETNDITRPYTIVLTDQNSEYGNRVDSPPENNTNGKDGNNAFDPINVNGVENKIFAEAWNEGIADIKDVSDSGIAEYIVNGDFKEDVSDTPQRNSNQIKFGNISSGNSDSIDQQANQQGRIKFAPPAANSNAANALMNTVRKAAN